jgi:hypothetical protein
MEASLLKEHTELQYLRAAGASARSRRSRRRDGKAHLSAERTAAWLEERAEKLRRRS